MGRIEEIGLALRKKCKDCSELSFNEQECHSLYYCPVRDAAALIESLAAEKDAANDRADAAVNDILDAAITPCSYCKHNPSNGGNCDCRNENHDMFSCWEWRGVEGEEDTRS